MEESFFFIFLHVSVQQTWPTQLAMFYAILTVDRLSIPL